MIPIARQYPGAREFVESYKREFPGADLHYLAVSGYGGCQILVEAIRRAGSLDREKLRDAILKMDHNTVFGGFRVDRDGLQVAHKMLMFQWQDGKKVIVWPEELAPFRVDPDGIQVAHKMVMFQWQEGKKVFVWPEELAPGKQRFPTPPWNQRP